jgi:hypothetical protein
MGALRAAVESVSQQAAEYGRPDGATRGYAAVMGVFAGTAAGLSAIAARTGRRAPEMTPFDLVLLGLATHKVSRIVAKDAVTSPVRAPFTRFEGSAGDAEVSEQVTGSGVRKAVGELVTCPFCLGTWVATALLAGQTFLRVLGGRRLRLPPARLCVSTAADDAGGAARVLSCWLGTRAPAASTSRSTLGAPPDGLCWGPTQTVAIECCHSSPTSRSRCTHSGLPTYEIRCRPALPWRRGGGYSRTALKQIGLTECRRHQGAR